MLVITYLIERTGNVTEGINIMHSGKMVIGGFVRGRGSLQDSPVGFLQKLNPHELLSKMIHVKSSEIVSISSF